MAGNPNINKTLKKKICGKIHAYCNICKPSRISPFKNYSGFGFQDPEARKKGNETIIRNGSLAGKNNPNYRGGLMRHSFVGWNEAQRQVWARDKVCRVCGKPPYKNRKLDVHHLVPRRDGGKHEVSNLIGVHHGCHIKLEYGKVQWK